MLAALLTLALAQTSPAHGEVREEVQLQLWVDPQTLIWLPQRPHEFIVKSVPIGLALQPPPVITLTPWYPPQQALEAPTLGDAPTLETPALRLDTDPLDPEELAVVPKGQALWVPGPAVVLSEQGAIAQGKKLADCRGERDALREGLPGWFWASTGFATGAALVGFLWFLAPRAP